VPARTAVRPTTHHNGGDHMIEFVSLDALTAGAAIVVAGAALYAALK
jgi:hypothetical protein